MRDLERAQMVWEMLESGEAQQMRWSEGHSREQIAVLGGFSARSLADWEARRSRPSIGYALRWWKAMAQLP